MTPLPEIRAAYAASRTRHNAGLPERETAPAWDDLPLAVRLSIIDAFFEGRRTLRFGAELEHPSARQSSGR